MAHRSNRPQSDAAPRPQDTQDLMSEQARQQLVMASEVSSVMCRAAEALQQIQQHVTQRAALRYQQMAEQMRGATSPAEMLAIQSTLMTTGLQEVAQYMQDMTTATLRIQSILMQARQSQDDSMGGQAANAAVHAWQSAMGGSHGASSFASPHH